MKRRDVMTAFLMSIVASGGCVQTETQPEEVPIWVDNQTEQRRDITLECLEDGKNDPLISTEFELAVGEERSFYAAPIHADGEYTVFVDLNGVTKEESITGGSLQNINVDLQATDDIRITPETS